ncbi:MAG: alpha/beta hydrolase [Desulfuromonas sp.]|nr:MAG: alpha/beta hydrolase [Desulfuromonas sp.]
MNSVWFAHGKESGPRGRKIEALSRVATALGWAMESPDYQGMDDPEARVAHLLECYQATSGKLVLVGSSMGGYVSLVAAQQLAPEGLFLMAPALAMPGYAQAEPELRAAQTLIVHGWRDAVVPPQNVISYAEARQIPLHLLDDDHPLGNSLRQLSSLFRDFLQEVAARPDATRLAPHI